MSDTLLYCNPLAVREKLFTKDALRWEKLYNFIGLAVCLNDRSNTLQQPIKLSIHDKCRMPEFRPSNITYEECCSLRAQEIWEASKRLDVPIGILWSGGIDSTTVLVSFLKNYGLEQVKQRVKVIASTEAILEHPIFYREYILPHFELISGEQVPWIIGTKDMILVTGEHNDQLFGSDMIKFFLAREGGERINSSFNRDFIFGYANKRINDPTVTNILIDAVLESGSKRGVVFERNTDWFWWLNFCFKWQAVHFRIYTLTFPRMIPSVDKSWDDQYLYHFFQTDNYQLWSMNNPQIRYIDDWKNYKLEAKKNIYSFDNNEDYFKNKIKRPSLQTILNQRHLAEAVSDNFKIIEKVDPLTYYNRFNNFK